jgi:multiple sugar transport system permease protein
MTGTELTRPLRESWIDATTESTAPVRRRRIVTRQGVWLFLQIAFVLLYCLFPFYWMLVSSLRAPNDTFNNSLLPLHPSVKNFQALFGSQNNFSYAVRNSVIIAGTATMVALFVAVFAAYALARLRFRRKQLILGLILACSMFPGIALLTPLFQLFTSLGWINQYQSMIVPDISFTLPLGIYILTAFFADMPWELEEAARVDGATAGQAFRRIIVPLAAPGVFTTAVIVFVAAWNEFLIASAMSIDLAAEPVTVAISKFQGDSEFQQPYGTQMAAGIIVTIPLIVLVLGLQRRIVAGLTAGAVKN